MKLSVDYKTGNKPPEHTDGVARLCMLNPKSLEVAGGIVSKKNAALDLQILQTSMEKVHFLTS